MNCIKKIIGTVLLLHFMVTLVAGQDSYLAKIVLRETAGLEWEREYIEFPLQITFSDSEKQNIDIVAIDTISGERIYCQSIREGNVPEENLAVIEIIFPAKIAANSTRTFLLREEKTGSHSPTDLKMEGTGLELIIENEYYRADLTRRNEPEPKTHSSGQLQELLIKLGFNQLLTNAEDRVHWAPNFKRRELEYYTTIAHWENPREYRVAAGDYLIRTVRQDTAPDHPEIMLSAMYKFYAGVPYFRFASEMDFIRDLPLELLRNDEMTTDSMFTHLAFQRPDGEIFNLRFKDRYKLLQKQPIEDNAPWICFYNIEQGFAYGSIRLRYDNHNRYGEMSPTWLPHTQIGEWLDRKYWNRRLIHDHLTYIPKGSRYLEENAYLVFKIGETDRFAPIKFWEERLRHPVEIMVYPARKIVINHNQKTPVHLWVVKD
jgi:hypothetical protein